jgi:hypothetical protein
VGILALLIAAIGGGLIWFFVIRNPKPELVATVALIPAVVKRLDATGQNDAFAVFIFTRPGEYESDETAVNLQFSIENSRLGLDWVLLGPRNIKDQDTIAQFIRSRGHTVNEQEMNGVRYLRTTDGDVATLGVDIAQTVYGLRADSVVDLIAEGFEWKI